MWIVLAKVDHLLWEKRSLETGTTGINCTLNCRPWHVSRNLVNDIVISGILTGKDGRENKTKEANEYLKNPSHSWNIPPPYHNNIDVRWHINYNGLYIKACT